MMLSDTRQADDLPIACSLSTAELHGRRTTIRDLFAGAEEVRELDHGWALRFPGDEARFRELADFIAVERACCQFLGFELSVPPGAGPLTLTVVARGEAKEFLRQLIDAGA